MNKLLAILGISAFFVFLSLNPVSAGGYSYPQHYYQPQYYLPTHEYQYDVFPSYQNLPTVTDRASYSDTTSSSYSRNYQGGIFERNTQYDEFTKIGRRGKFIRTVSATESERYLGPSETENRIFDNRVLTNREYSSVPENPSVYNGGSLWRYKSSYSPSSYGGDRYGSGYYYQPMYNSLGYYNWRY